MSEVVIVTGASSGIGAATARLLGAQGASVVVNYMSSAALAEGVVAEVKAAGGNAIAVQADVGSNADIVRMFAETDKAFGPVTGLVNNAAINTESHRSMETYDFDEFMRILAVNTAGVLICCREAVKRMSTKHGGKGGAIVNVSSIGALTGSPGRFIHYAGSKGAVDSMTLGIAGEVVRDGIRVNAVRPGMIDTPIHAKTGQADRIKEFASKTPLGRAGRPEEVAESIVWLLSPKASLVTGAILNVMGAQR
jgi:NAD(P)-dependent dehydrogenase (short-subunit alcohol dehydrogenase family)